jgi:hypothetical protein
VANVLIVEDGRDIAKPTRHQGVLAAVAAQLEGT